MSKVRDFISASLISAGIPAASNIYYISGASNDAWGSYWVDYVDSDNWFDGTTTFSTASTVGSFANVSTGNNSVILMAPSSHQCSSAFTYDYNYTHMVGAQPFMRHKHRSRIKLIGRVKAQKKITKSRKRPVEYFFNYFALNYFAGSESVPRSFLLGQTNHTSQRRGWTLNPELWTLNIN